MSSNANNRGSNVLFRENGRIACNCGWEVRFGYGVAVTLAIFEAKRFLVLILEIFAEWQIILFAGGFRPVIFTLVDVGLGLPTALITVRTIRASKVPRCCAETKRTLRCLLVVIMICVVMNAATLVCIGCHMSVRQEALVDVFNASMHLYVNAASYKYAIDEVQFIFQCCGHSSYADWFLFDWQRVDYAPREEMVDQNNPLSDEIYRDRGVPFSCCNIRAMSPCVHMEIMDDDVKTINTSGCAGIISPVLLRIVIVAYVMTSTLVITQVLLAFLIAKIIRKLLPGMCRLYYYPTGSANGSSNVSLDVTSSEAERQNSNRSPRNSNLRFSKRSKKPDGRTVKKIKRITPMRWTRFRNKESPRNNSDSTSSQFDSPPMNRSNRACVILEAAKIKPSIHEEHTISKKRIQYRR